MRFKLKNPANAVCHEVLNLRKQVGFLTDTPALAEAYRVHIKSLEPWFLTLAQDRKCDITNTAGLTFVIPQIDM